MRSLQAFSFFTTKLRVSDCKDRGAEDISYTQQKQILRLRSESEIYSVEPICISAQLRIEIEVIMILMFIL